MRFAIGSTMEQGGDPGTSSTGGEPGCPDGTTRTDAWGVFVHEMGHWRGLGHDLMGECQGAGPAALYAPAPTYEITSMCYSESMPAIKGGSGVAGIVPRRTISQDEIQGATAQFSGHFVANYHFASCPGCTWSGTPEFWMFTPNSNHWWGGSVVSLNNNASVPYPEVYQRVQGADADFDDNGVFLVSARVKAIHNTVTPRAVIFVRHVHGSLINHEQKCDSGPLTVGSWTVVSCYVYLGSNTAETFEYGVRVTEKIDIDWVKVADK